MHTKTALTGAALAAVAAAAPLPQIVTEITQPVQYTYPVGFGNVYGPTYSYPSWGRRGWRGSRFRGYPYASYGSVPVGSASLGFLPGGSTTTINGVPLADPYPGWDFKTRTEADAAGAADTANAASAEVTDSSFKITKRDPQIVTEISQPVQGIVPPGFPTPYASTYTVSYNGGQKGWGGYPYGGWRGNPYGYGAGYPGYVNFDNDFKVRTEAGVASAEITDSSFKITKRAEEEDDEALEKRQVFLNSGYYPNASPAYQAWADYFNGVNNNAVGSASLSLGSSTFSISNGAPVPAYPFPNYPLPAGFPVPSGYVFPSGFPYAATYNPSTGTASTFTISKE